MEKTIGTCSLYGGPVVSGRGAPDHCTRCNATRSGGYGAVIPMRNPLHIPSSIQFGIAAPGDALMAVKAA